MSGPRLPRARGVSGIFLACALLAVTETAIDAWVHRPMAEFLVKRFPIKRQWLTRFQTCAPNLNAARTYGPQGFGIKTPQEYRGPSLF